MKVEAVVIASELGFPFGYITPLQVNSLRGWTDSMISSKYWESVNPNCWGNVYGHENPSDIASRCVLPKELDEGTHVVITAFTLIGNFLGSDENGFHNWSIASVQKTILGSDSLIRCGEVRTLDGIRLHRPYKLALITPPFSDENN
ncbi:unnamed protein product [Lepeophtheirus salmonis]|uniref:(salmon louse) hypothetical protein n=1 Tax=Lepeophtheirus salmonis TaxID=72036 RepID=A0A7R8CJZ1_LEPSM|nr:unnamed protein product [Lepeophtheirus salmonis]CAF2845821.1 unnamed protein product [Lepeophtheirus salmonis]